VSYVLCAGLATRDTILAVPEQPPPDGRVVADELVVAGGGPAATAAVALTRLGVEARFAGVVGDDDAGAFIRDGLEREGVDVSALTVVHGARSPQSTVLVTPGGARAIVHHPGDGMNGLRVDAGVAREAAWVHVDQVGYRAARQLGARLSVDAGNPIDGLDLRRVSLYGPTEAALRESFGDARTALAAGAELVVVTRGADGSTATTRDGTTIEAPGFAVAVVSTLGAGDVFHGALLAELMQGVQLAEALRRANAAAALSCRALDGRSAIPGPGEVERMVA
jgi:sulfofructose kinase